MKELLHVFLLCNEPKDTRAGGSSENLVVGRGAEIDINMYYIGILEKKVLLLLLPKFGVQSELP